MYRIEHYNLDKSIQTIEQSTNKVNAIRIAKRLVSECLGNQQVYVHRFSKSGDEGVVWYYATGGES